MKASSAAAHLDRQRFFLAIIVTIVPLVMTVTALILWSQGTGPGLLGGALLVSMYALTMFGLEVGYHRLFTHRSFKASPLLRVVLAILGSMSFEGPVIWWVAVHRRHHAFADREGDPHSPNLAGAGLRGRLSGLFHAHVGWMFRSASTAPALVENFPRDLQRDRPILQVNKYYFYWVALGFLFPTIVGAALTQSWRGALIGLLWGGFVRVFLTSQFSFALNSLSHIPVGVRRLRTAGHDRSRDNWLLVIPTFGQGYHNRHHAFPTVAILGAEWWHFDLGGWLLAALEKLGWVSEVRRLGPAWKEGWRQEEPQPARLRKSRGLREGSGFEKLRSRTIGCVTRGRIDFKRSPGLDGRFDPRGGRTDERTHSAA